MQHSLPVEHKNAVVRQRKADPILREGEIATLNIPFENCHAAIDVLKVPTVKVVLKRIVLVNDT